MAEVPEHLLQRSAERRKALGLPVPGEEDERRAAADAPARTQVRRCASAGRGRGCPPARRRDAERVSRQEDVETASGAKIPAHLLERSQARRAAWPVATRHAARRRAGGGDRDRDDRSAGAGRHRARRPHAAPAHRRQVGFDPADEGRGPGQGARLAAPARRRARVDPDPDGGRHDLLGARARAAALARRLQQDAEPVEGAVVLPGSPGAAHDVPPDGRRRDDPGRRARVARVRALHRHQPVEQARPTAGSRSRCSRCSSCCGPCSSSSARSSGDPGFNFVFPWNDGIFFEL